MLAEPPIERESDMLTWLQEELQARRITSAEFKTLAREHYYQKI